MYVRKRGLVLFHNILRHMIQYKLERFFFVFCFLFGGGGRNLQDSFNVTAQILQNKTRGGVGMGTVGADNKFTFIIIFGR